MIKQSIVNSNTTSWYDTNKFNEILATIDNSNFNHKNKIGKLKFSDINKLINGIKGNIISEADTKKKINELNEIKKGEIKRKRLIENQKKLLSLFDDLKTIFNVNENESEGESVNDNVNENENESGNENENENESVNESENDNDNDSDNENKNENENESDDGQYYKIKQINNIFKMIDKKSFKDQIDIFKKKIEWLNDYWHMEYYEDNKETNLRIFKLKLAHILNDVNDNLFKEIFGFTSVKLADKLINTTRREENQILINDVKTNRDKIFEQEYGKFVIQPAHKRDDLLDTVKVIQQFNKTIQSYLT